MKIRPSAPSVPRDSATVILVRERTENEPFEVLLMRRHEKQDFMGKAFVFPGGQLDKKDCDPKLAEHATGLSSKDAKRRLNETDLSDETALGLFFTAVRETFEESGVLLADTVSGNPINLEDPDTQIRFATYRGMVYRGKITLEELARKEQIAYPLDRILPFSRWITPYEQPKRFDTRFFLAQMPPHQTPAHDAVEMTKTIWISPREALLQQASGKLLLFPPTLKTLEEISLCPTATELFSFASSREIKPILPERISDEKTPGIMLPHDPEYTIEAYKQTLRPMETSRIVFADGRFKTVAYENQ